MAPRVSFGIDSLPTAIPIIFDQAQASVATHKKNCVALFKLQSAAAEVVESVHRGRGNEEVKLIGERVFAEAFLDMLNRVLVVKKSTPTADRIIKFAASYIKFLNNKASENEEEDTPASRFVARLLKYFLKGFQARSKEVRFRCLNFVSEIVSNLGELDQDLYAELRAALLERLADKEPSVRVHSVAALSILAASEDPYDLDDDEPPIINSLFSALRYDPAAEVRRAALVHMPFTPATLPALLTRMRDVDTLTRKLVFTTVLPRLASPRQLTIAQREQIISQGLGDRADAVRVAASKVLCSWVDTCEGDLVGFVSLFDIHTPDIVRDALKSIFVTRADIVKGVEFDDAFWSDLKPETALLARAFVEHCIETSDEARLEAVLPVVTALAFRLQNEYNQFLAVLEYISAEEDRDDEETDTREEESANVQLVMSELLRLAVHLDYSDEIGRRRMFGVVRNMLAHPELPEALIDPCVGILQIISPNERDLIRIIVEVISELRDSGAEGDESMVMDNNESTFATAHPNGLSSRSQLRRNLHEMTSEEKLQADMTDLRCLSLCVAVLGRVHGSFDENSTLRGVLEDLIVPSVQRKELVLREKGLVCLGLCCLIAKNMALGSFQLFLSQVKSSPESLRLKVVQIVFDIMMTYEKDLFGGGESIGEKVITFLMQALEVEESKNVQALMCLGLAKLMLFGIISDERILMSLIFAYVSPTNADNQELRQCLAYFLPVYCYSLPTNQNRLQSIFLKTFELILQVYEELEDDQDMITPLQFGQLLLDWTDPTKVVGASDRDDLSPVHLHLAVDIVRALYNNDRAAEERKTFCLLLSKLVFPALADQTLLYTLYILIVNLTELIPFEDSTTDKAFLRFKQRFEKHFAESLADYDEQECFHDSGGSYGEVFEFLGITRPKQRRFEMRGSATSKSKELRNQVADDGVSEAGSGADAQEAPPSKARNRKRGIGSIIGQKAPSPEQTSGSSSSDGSERESTSEVERKPVEAKSTRSKKLKSKTHSIPEEEESSSSSSGQEVGENQEMDAQSQIVSEVEEDERQITPVPSTPPRRKRGAKRLHTPTKSPSMASPLPKRQNRGTRLRNGRKANAPQGKIASSTISDLEKKGKTKQSTAPEPLPAPVQKQRQRRPPPPPKLQSTKRKAIPEIVESSEPEDEDEEDESAESASDASIPQQTIQRARGKQAKSRPAPRVMEEKIGWDDSSDM